MEPRRSLKWIGDSLGISGGTIRWPAGQFGPHIWHGGCFDSWVLGRCMSFRPFTSESYCESDRLAAWRDALGGARLHPTAAAIFHTTGVPPSPPHPPRAAYPN